MGGEIAKVLAKDHAEMKKKFVFQDWKKINEQRAGVDRAVQPRDQDLMLRRALRVALPTAAPTAHAATRMAASDHDLHALRPGLRLPLAVFFLLFFVAPLAMLVFVSLLHRHRA